MIDDIVKDLDKEMTVAETEEKDAQADYEQAMKDGAEKRASDSKTVADKKAALEGHSDDKASASKELAATLQAIEALHGECDWILKYFDLRKEARTSEIDALGKAKAVLNGADYSLLQLKSRSKFLA